MTRNTIRNVVIALALSALALFPFVSAPAAALASDCYPTLGQGGC